MAIDQTQLIQMLLQGGGGGTPQPTSGLQDPSLSGLMLGPQGMGFGGGGSLMGGGPTGFGGGGGGGFGGLDISQLLAQLQAAPGVTGAGLTSGIGAGGLGGGFGAGGPMGQEPPGSMPTPSQQGQAGLGAANTTLQLLRLLREGTGLGKALLNIFPKGPTVTDLQELNLPGMPEDVRAALSGVTPLGGPSPTPGGTGAFNLNQLMTPQGPGTFDLSQLMTPAGLPGPGEVLGPGGVPALAGELGPAGEGLTTTTGGLNFSTLLPGIGAGLQGAEGLFRSVTSPTAAGKGFGAAEAAASPLVFTQPEIGIPVEIGLHILDAIFGGGGLFGGGQRDDFPERLSGTIGGEQAALSAFSSAVRQAQSPEELSQALTTFKNAVESAGVGGFASRPGVFGPPGFQFGGLPGAGGSQREGGIVFDPDPFSSIIGRDIQSQLTQFAKRDQAKAAFQQALAERQAAPQQTPARPQVAQAPPTALNLPGSPDSDLVTMLRQMGLI